ncbi:hypothetical protein DSO57_1026842 [Entomophthora muscae]|uniref:Uncharacterized protein n=1 Tax=Entomophthora muscae TaxID=34485 RepID=A0ACC2RT54_9FUNG|nr:hypothetical protein DSO57_1026842 [Entomophthora muscae]
MVPNNSFEMTTPTSTGQSRNSSTLRRQRSARRGSRIRVVHRRQKSGPSESSDSSIEGLPKDFAPPLPTLPKVQDTNISNLAWKPHWKTPSIDFDRIKGVLLGSEKIHHATEKQVYLAHDLILRMGWLDDPEVVWKYRLRRPKNLAPLSTMAPFSLIEKWMYFGIGVGVSCSVILPKPISYLAFIASFTLVGRGMRLIYWTRRLNWWGNVFNQFVGIYSDLDQHIKRSMNWFQEIELVSRGFRDFANPPAASPAEPRAELLSRFYKILKQIQIKFETQSSSSDAEGCVSPVIQLSKVKQQMEQTYVARTELLMQVFSKLAVSKDIQQAGHLFDSLSRSGNGHIIQVVSLLEPRNPSTLSRSPSLSNDSSFSKEVDQESSKLNQAMRSLNTLEFELRSWHAQLHVFNQAITAKTTPPRALASQFQRMVQSIHSIASDAELVSRHLESWCSPGTSQTSLSSPPLSPDTLQSPPLIYQDYPCEDPRELLSLKEEVYEGDPLPPTEPPSFEERRARRQALYEENLSKREQQVSFLSMVQELDDAIRTHAQARASNRAEQNEIAPSISVLPPGALPVANLSS